VTGLPSTQSQGIKFALTSGFSVVLLLLAVVVWLGLSNMEAIQSQLNRIVENHNVEPAAECYGLMYDIDRWVISAAFDHLSAHPSCVADPHQLWTINLSGQSICEEHFLEFFTEQFRNKRVPARNICFEITETTAIRNLGRAAELMSTLKAMGCRFALDDFGSGLSSFNYLKHLDTDFLKIDGSFVKDMLDDAMDCAMVESINQIGQLLGLRTIAEWVEHEQVFTKLPALRIDYAQGYYIHKPEPLPARRSGSRISA